MAEKRLTRQELAWLLAQEARGAATSLREGVTQLKQPSPAIHVREGEVSSVESSLDALDDAVGMLSLLEARPPGRGRRGRIDVAALLYELAPNARIAIEPGAGTEVFGDENDLCRLLHVLVSQTGDPGAPSGSASPELRIRRQGDLVRISVELGPDRSATADVERRWLSRMAMRLGGRLELEGGTQSLLLPADAASAQRELEALRKELAQAQQLGEAYARELAEVFSAGDLPAERAEAVEATAPAQRFGLLVSTAGALIRTLRALLSGLRADAALASESLGESAPLCQNLAQRVSATAELLGELRRVEECPVDEPVLDFNLAETVKEIAHAAEGRAARHGVKLVTDVPATVRAQTRRAAFGLMLRGLLDHAIAATPRAGEVLLRLRSDQAGTTLLVEDGGPTVPENLRTDLLKRRVDPSALGRPGGIALLVADTAADHLGCPLSLRQAATGRVQLVVSLSG